MNGRILGGFSGGQPPTASSIGTALRDAPGYYELKRQGGQKSKLKTICIFFNYINYTSSLSYQYDRKYQ